jgi:hypothetical protein
MLLLLLQIVQVAILWTHDWAPMHPLNDVAAVRREDSLGRLGWITLIQSVPFTIGLVATAFRLRGAPVSWLGNWLWISYSILFAGELRAWWWPYLIRPDPARAERYAALFGRTHAVLPVRNGIVPNTLHCILHLATVATLATLALTHEKLS